MTNYGLPLIFKAINVETGEEVIPDDSSKLKDLYDWLKCAPKAADKWISLQQTGFTDAAGKDVYFGDVLIDDSEWIGVAQLDDYGHIEVRGIHGSENRREYYLAYQFEDLQIIGNVYEPPSKWLERARAIWPDAQLPEGVRG